MNLNRNFSISVQAARNLSLLMLASTALVASASAGTFTEAPPVSSGSGCLSTPSSQNSSGNTGTITLMRITEVSVSSGGRVVILGGDAVLNAAYASASHDAQWNNPKRTGQLTEISFALDPSTSPSSSGGASSPDLIKRAKIVSQECINNARIAMVSGMSLKLGGTWDFGSGQWPSRCVAQARLKPWVDWTWDGGTFQWGSLEGCTLAVTNPQDKTVSTIVTGAGAAP
ncbi:MAG: hypothetical protein H7222_15825 [Methylotenera sp.]|nr:hypothetical protein [Oligoflexia bacterium]